MAVFEEYLWIAIAGGVFGFIYGFLIGANDVANAFASSVSSKSLTLKQAVLAAAIFEFSGAFFLGARVTSTIRSKVVDIKLYDDKPDVLMFGMFTALLSASIMLWGATALGLPVSTTHDIVGCIMGFSIAAKGFDSVEWDVARKLFMSWLVSPLVAGSVAFFFFFMVKRFVMEAKDPFHRAYYTFPIVIFIGIGIDLFYILYKGSSNFDLTDKVGFVVPICFAVGFGCGLVWVFLVGPFVKVRIEKKMQLVAEAKAQQVEVVDLEDVPEQAHTAGAHQDFDEVMVDDDVDAMKKPTKTVTLPPAAVSKAAAKPEQVAKLTNGDVPPANEGLLGQFARNTYNQDLHYQSMHENAQAAQIWEDGKEYDPYAESLFNYIQVFTACLNSFAHGANDVSNTIAPLSAIIYIYQNGEAQSKSQVDKWVLAFGGAAIVIGLLLYGYKVMKSIGYKLTKLSPSRGACAELAASLTVVTASFLSIPVSSTQCIVGAVSGVGLVNGVKNVNWLMLFRVCTGWVLMFFMAVTLSAGVFAFATFSPDL